LDLKYFHHNKNKALKTRSISTRILKLLSLAVVSFLMYSCDGKITKSNNGNDLFSYFDAQARKTVEENTAIHLLPVVIDSGKKQWENNDVYNWRSGFWPGIEWYLYESTKDEFWKKAAEKSTEQLIAVIDTTVSNHDLGFQFYCSYGNGFRLTGNPAYKEVLLRAADSLARLYNPTVGTILSWPGRVKEKGWPHNTIIDNMMNLELLFWAAKNGGSKNLYDIAVKHAETTMKNHFRPDFSTYHVLVYDTITGKVIKGVTHQGYADNSMWARGQAWGIYGFTMTYRETGNKEFLQTAINAADIYLKRLPKDHVPFWDFDDPAIPNTARDASAAAIVASALLELSTLCTEVDLKNKYKNAASAMIEELSSERYLSKETNHAFLLHSTGNKPSNKDVDVPIIYADYYFLEALLRLKKM
jgi:unsaturated chondroitin disaccharide hydrolase